MSKLENLPYENELRYTENKELEEAIKQLEDLKVDRESFLQKDQEHDEIYLKDIKAIETVLKKLERLQEENRHLNIVILKDYISKFVIKNILERDKANYIDGIHSDNKVEAVQKYIEYLEKELLGEIEICH